MARGAEHGGGAPGPSTVKGECDLVPKKKMSEVFSLPPHAGPGDAPKGASLGLGGRANPFFVLYHIGKMLESMKICLKCPVFNALGAVVCRPQSLARRWVGWRTERRVTWPW